MVRPLSFASSTRTSTDSKRTGSLGRANNNNNNNNSTTNVGKRSDIFRRPTSRSRQLRGTTTINTNNNKYNNNSTIKNQIKNNYPHNNTPKTNNRSNMVVASSTTTATSSSTKATIGLPKSSTKKSVVQQQQPQTITTTTESSLVSSSSFSPSEIEDLRYAFSLFDINQEGRISCTELRNVLESLKDEERDATSSSEEEVTTTQGNFMFPHLDSLLTELSQQYPITSKSTHKLSESSERVDDDDVVVVEDDETIYLTFDDYIQLMERTSLSNSMQNDNDEDENPFEQNTNNHFAHVFSLFDLDGKGYISISDLERVANELGETDMTHEELDEMMERANSECNGKVTLSEFSNLMTKSLFDHLSSSPFDNNNTIDNEEYYNNEDNKNNNDSNEQKQEVPTAAVVKREMNEIENPTSNAIEPTTSIQQNKNKSKKKKKSNK